MEIAYTAHTETCTLLLDAEGICRSVQAASSQLAANGGARPTRIPTSAEKCVGAQYVATLDLTAPGGMGAMPKPGAQMLFARAEANGRITLIRSAPVVRFEPAASAAPASAKMRGRGESGVHERPDTSAGDEELTLPCEPPTMPGTPRPSLLSAASVPHWNNPPPAAPPRYSAPPAPRGSLTPPRPTARSSAPPPEPARPSGVVPAGTAWRTPIPPAPRPAKIDPRVDSTTDCETEAFTRPMRREDVPLGATTPSSGVRPPSASVPPRRPSIVRVSATDWGDLETRPYRRASR
jgi:hypothetical protein